jgi:hypothetical protein
VSGEGGASRKKRRSWILVDEQDTGVAGIEEGEGDAWKQRESAAVANEVQGDAVIRRTSEGARGKETPGSPGTEGKERGSVRFGYVTDRVTEVTPRCSADLQP